MHDFILQVASIPVDYIFAGGIPAVCEEIQNQLVNLEKQSRL